MVGTLSGAVSLKSALYVIAPPGAARGAGAWRECVDASETE